MPVIDVKTYGSWRIFGVTIRRHLHHEMKNFLGGVLNALLVMVCHAFEFFYLLPLVGMTIEMAAMLFLSAYGFIFLLRAFNSANAFVRDVHGKRLSSVIQILPWSFAWFAASVITAATLSILINTLPLWLAAKIILGSSLVFSNVHWGWFISIYILSVWMMASLLLVVAAVSSRVWFEESVWTQFMFPMQVTGALFATLESVQAKFPCFALIMRCNPVTYAIEGMRGALFGNPAIDLLVCTVVLLVSAGLCSYGFYYALRRRLDAV